MGNLLSLYWQGNFATSPDFNISTHISGALPFTAAPSTLSGVLIDNGKKSAESKSEVLTSSSDSGDEYTTIEVTTQSSARSNPTKDVDAGIEVAISSVQENKEKDRNTLISRIQPRGIRLYEDPAKDRVAIEQQYIPPLAVNAAATDMTPLENHKTTKISKEKAQTRGQLPLPTKKPMMVRIPHTPIQLFGRRHIRPTAELMHRELESESGKTINNPL